MAKEGFKEIIDKTAGKLNEVKESLENASDSAKKNINEAAKWVEEKTPVVIDKVEDTVEGIEEFVDSTAKNAKRWVKAQNDANKLRKMHYDLDTLRPIFDDNLPKSYSDYPLINIVNKDEKRDSNPVCAGSYGFMTETKDLDVPNIYAASFDKFGIVLDEDLEEGVYYANPYVPGEYIESNRYAIYLKQERVRELINIAKSLGAKYVNVSFSIEEKMSEEQKGKLSLKAGKNKSEVEAEKKIKESLKLSIGETQKYKGHNNPKYPNLIYYKNDKTIKELIDERINGDNELLKHDYSIVYATASSSKIKEAAKVDSAVKTLKLGATQSLALCYEVESQIRLSYTIEF